MEQSQADYFEKKTTQLDVCQITAFYNLLPVLFLTNNPRWAGTSSLVMWPQRTTPRMKHVLVTLVSTKHFAGTQEESQLLGIHSKSAMVFHVHGVRQCTSMPRTPTENTNLATYYSSRTTFIFM